MVWFFSTLHYKKDFMGKFATVSSYFLFRKAVNITVSFPDYDDVSSVVKNCQGVVWFLEGNQVIKKFIKLSNSCSENLFISFMFLLLLKDDYIFY